MEARIRHLSDGTPLWVRPIRADDKRFLAAGLHNLSEQSVQRRFLTWRQSFSRAELRYLTEVDGHDHIALVAEYPTAPARRLIGVTRFVREQDDPATAEAAIVVADDWHGRGVGSLLAAELAVEARRHRVEHFTATMAADNAPAHKLMAKLTRHLESRPSANGVFEHVTDLAA